MEDHAVCMRLTGCVVEALNKWKKVPHHHGLAEVVCDELKETTNHLHSKEWELKECNQVCQEHLQTLFFCQANETAPVPAHKVYGLHAADVRCSHLSFSLQNCA